VAALRLRPMRDDELAAFLPRGEEGYRRQLTDFAGMSEAEARAKAARDYANVFPGGRVQEDHFVFVVETEPEARRVGYLVYALRAEGRKAWLYELEIDEAERGRGYGGEAMRLFEEDTRARGVQEVGLNVFAGNDVARSLYRSAGYHEQSVWMIKRLDPP
jgi:ribosomal protein S18 acetylase RimI-like enzyme